MINQNVSQGDNLRQIDDVGTVTGHILAPGYAERHGGPITWKEIIFLEALMDDSDLTVIEGYFRRYFMLSEFAFYALAGVK